MTVVYESAFGVAMLDEPLCLEMARQAGHDMVIANTGRARRSGVVWTYRPLKDWHAVIASLGIEVPEDRVKPPNDLEVLAARWPDGVLVLATVEVDPDVVP